jgi:hypothetical protein
LKPGFLCQGTPAKGMGQPTRQRKRQRMLVGRRAERRDVPTLAARAKPAVRVMRRCLLGQAKRTNAWFGRRAVLARCTPPRAPDGEKMANSRGVRPVGSFSRLACLHIALSFRR